MEVTGGRLYLGGKSFTRVGGSPRNYLGSVDLATSAVNSWAPTAGAQVKGMVLSPDTSRLYLAGDFTTLNGGSHQYVGALRAPPPARCSPGSPRETPPPTAASPRGTSSTTR